MARKTAIAVVAALVLLGTIAGAGGIVAGADSGTHVGVDEPASAAQAECGYPLEVEDATGETVTIEEEPQRVVTTNPSAAQTMKEIGAWDKVVGITEHARYLEGADEKADVTGESGASVERIVDQEPDLVLVPNATYGHQDLVQQLRDADLTVYHFAFAESIDDIREKTLLTGQLVGECDGAEETVEWMDEQMAPVEAAVEGQDRPLALYVFFGWTAGEGTFIGQIIETAGADNLAAEEGIQGYQEISDEVVAEADPEWLVLNDNADSVPEGEAYEGTTAVQEDNVVVVNESYISQPAPRVVIPVRKMAKAFHPEAYAEANATPTETPTPSQTETPTPTEAEDDPETPSPTPTDAPGFGLAAALIALLATLVIARRR